MRARLIFRYKATQGELLVEMVVWALPQCTADRPHGLKYRLHCSRAGSCVARYDNESGKGDHRHYGDGPEFPYAFETIERLLADFREDCSRLAGWRW
jgi:hypothetical protein